MYALIMAWLIFVSRNGSLTQKVYDLGALLSYTDLALILITSPAKVKTIT
jgi:hypothetical protein